MRCARTHRSVVPMALLPCALASPLFLAGRGGGSEILAEPSYTSLYPDLRPIFNLGRPEEDSRLNPDTTRSQQKTVLCITSNKAASTSLTRFARACAATVALLATTAAMAAPYAITYQGHIAHSGMPADAPDGAAFTLTLVLDNGATSAANQSWAIAQITCGFWRWRVDAARSVTVALDMSGGIALGAGNATTNATGALTTVFGSVNTGGPLAWSDYGVSGLPAGGTAIGWYADGAAMPFGVAAPWGGSFDDGLGTPAGGVQMSPGRWSAPLPFTGTCDASAVPPSPPTPPAPAAVPALSALGMPLLSAMLGLLAWLAVMRKI